MAQASKTTAITEPSATFSSPGEIVRDPSLTPAEKLEALDRWKQAETDLERAAGEGMEAPPGARKNSRLDEINAAILAMQRK